FDIFSVGKMLECHWGGVDPARSWKRNERTDDLTGSLEKKKRRYLTRSSTKKKIICNGEETTGLLISGNLYWDSNQGVWSELSEEVAKELSKSVVSLALMDASLVKALNDNKRMDHDNLKVQVHHFENVTTGFLGEYDLDHNIATVNVMNFADLKAVVWGDLMGFPPHNMVASLGMDPSGKLMGTSGTAFQVDLNGVETLHCPRSLRYACILVCVF
ncbi:hypothetical protein BAE44_0010035, partial [Dichanthelium oligosanthes]